MTSSWSLDLDPRTEMNPDRSSMAIMACVLPPMDGMVSSWKSKNMHWPMLVDGGEVKIMVMQLANGTCHTRAKEVGHQINVMTGEMSMVGERTLVKSGLECFIVGMAEEVMELSRLSSSLDFFLSEVSAFTRNAEWKYGGVGRTRNFGGNGSCR